MDTWLRIFFLGRVRELARDLSGEFVNIPPGDGNEAIWEIDAEVCREDVLGS
jgi:hypothetical protein